MKGNSLSKTPSPIKDRIFGSKTNKKGSAASKYTAKGIQFSSSVITTLENKKDEYNAKHPNNKVSLATLKAVFRRGAGAYSTSHRPTISGGRPNSRSAWAFARVNKFLLKKGGTKVKAAYVQDDDLMAKGGQIKLLAPNLKPSNLTPEQWHLVRTPEFKAWFGDWETDPQNASQVVDNNGEPLVCFHRNKKKFTIFDIDKQLNGWLGKGFYFSESKLEFKNYGKILLSVFLNIKKPFIVKGQSPTDFLYELKELFGSDEFDTTEKLKRNKYDGVIYKHWDYEGIIISCFKPEKIKLADGTNTTFDAENPDIRYEKGGNLGFESTKKLIDNVKKYGLKIIGKESVATDGTKYRYDTYIIKEGSVHNWLVNLFEKAAEESGNRYATNFYYKDIYSIAYDRPKYKGVINGKIQMSELIEHPNMDDSMNTLFEGRNPDVRYAKGGLLAPNDKPSNLTPEQYKLVRTDAFKAWFGDWENDPENSSKVVDENGEPMMVMHKTSADFYIFDKDKIGDANKFTIINGFFFGNYKKKSENLRNIECFINLMNPIILNETDTFFNSVAYQEAVQHFLINGTEDYLREYLEYEEYENVDDILSRWENADGVIVKNLLYDNFKTEIVAFEPTQIKLADGSNTTFDANNPDIRYDEGGETQKETLLGINSLWEKAKKDFKHKGFEVRNGGVSKTVYGTSCYFYINYEQKSSENYGNGWKIRVSDHSATNVNRLQSEHFIFNESDINKVLNEAELFFKPELFKKIEQIKEISEEKVVIVPKDINVKVVTENVYNPLTDAIITDLGISAKGNQTYLVKRLKTIKGIVNKRIDKYEDGGLLAPNDKPSNLTPEQYKLVRTPEFKAWFGDWENDTENASKVVDDNGEPLVVYHGTKKKFNIFKINEANPYSFFAENYKYANEYANSEDFVGKPKLYKCFLNIRTPFDSSGVKFWRESPIVDTYIIQQIEKDIKKGIIVKKDIDYKIIKTLKDFIEPQLRYGNTILWHIFRNDGMGYSDFLKTYDKDLSDKNKNKKRGWLKNFLEGFGYNGFIQYENIYGEEVKNYERESKKNPYYASKVYAVFEPNQIKLADGRNKTFDGNNPDIRYEQGGLLAPNLQPSNLTYEQWHL
ncbi:MAG: DUF5824 family protein, partial [Candidatus Kapaibacteriota bacterium]